MSASAPKSSPSAGLRRKARQRSHPSPARDGRELRPLLLGISDALGFVVSISIIVILSFCFELRAAETSFALDNAGTFLLWIYYLRVPVKGAVQNLLRSKGTRKEKDTLV
jgi:hypothetical protein